MAEQAGDRARNARRQVSPDEHRDFLRKIGLNSIFTLEGASELEVIGREEAKRAYTERFSGENRCFTGAELHSVMVSSKCERLSLVSMRVAEEGEESCGGYFEKPWDFPVYERELQCFVPLRALNPKRTWEAWEDKLAFRQGEGLVRAQFRLLDENGDGHIDKEELLAVMRAVDPKAWTDARVDRLASVVDVNGDGRIQIDEFVNWVFGATSVGTENPSWVRAAENYIGLCTEVDQHKL